ncbi:A disintegrin and metalloproteinase with thrombospondin motifs 9-like isoform X3 [Asterias amurensis]|uniref:A disintegrin and metalloproteinase with thrombospondin motifs 9-like isoform X3 n=1 Tax=Asterias amurensis TaxID=7602 RepID=UPI003AB803C3
MCSLNINTTLFAAIVLLYLALAVRLAQGFNLRSLHLTSHGDRLEGISEYEIVTPVRLDGHTGLPLASDVKSHHFQKRSVAPSNSDGLEGEDEPQATFLLGAFHQQFQLNLSRDNSFLSPSFVMEFLGDDNEDEAEESGTVAPLHCFYRGSVNGQVSSSAVFSLCDGMYGLFQTPEGTQYFVEPLDDFPSSEGSTRPHIVYPTTALQDFNKNSGCGLTDEDLADKKPSSNATNDVPGPHSHHQHKHHQGNGRRHSRKRNQNNLASQLYQMHQRISKSINRQQENNSSSDTSKTDTSHHRSKRFISFTRHVELMVVADHKMFNHHGPNLEHYLLTLVALVNKIFKDPSIGNDINIVLVKLLVLHREEADLSITSDAPQSLRNFCIWQQDRNNKNDDHPHHYDTAVLITKEDICRSVSDCDTLGLAELGTMCDPAHSCSIVQDNGLSAAFTMAHELGHVFNLPHDDNTKCRELSKDQSGNYGVMAPTLNYQINPWTWSRCSKSQITEYLEEIRIDVYDPNSKGIKKSMGYGQCLLDTPRDAQILPKYQPGEVYNISKQCELVFGEGATVCPILRTCSRLWCTGSFQGSRRGCRTQHMPWADGTPCGNNKWCDRGKCVGQAHSTEPVDGGWGKWEGYGDCSRTCGGGVKQAVRQCTEPSPQNGGKYCIGRRVRFRSCNSRTCPVNSIPFREQQCADFNGNNFNIQGVPRDVRWVAKYTGVQIKERCSLFCRVDGSIAFYKLAKKVIDGTPCGEDTDDICVQGQCWGAGCDHILGSQTTKDNCGVCGGDNRSCRRVSGSYNKAKYGYNKVVEIPAGSTRIDVKQHSYRGIPEDDNYLAIRGSNGDYLLNGHFVVSMFQREVKIGNIMLEYSGSNNSIEKITCHEKITFNITIYVLSVGNVTPPDIRYEYNVPIVGNVVYIWDMYGEWAPCNKICHGEKIRPLRCLRQNDRVEVERGYCHSDRPEPLAAKCNTGCEVRWQVTAESDCSSSCGTGRRTRRVQCIKTVAMRRTIVVVDAHCSDQSRPAEVVECHIECEMAHWEYSSWSQCSRSCNGGTRRRSASCRDSNGYYTPDNNCDRSSRQTVERCNTEECPQWKAESWSDCSVTCGDGKVQRSVRCYRGAQMVDSSQCDQSSKLEEAMPCQMQECAVWHQGEWGPCSATCGQGTVQRLVSCLHGNQKVDSIQCGLSFMPETTRSCEVTECPFWQQGEWGSCSVSCGQGERQRLVSCYLGNYIVDSDQCNQFTEPETTELCDAGECTSWRAEDSGPCSVTCGQGQRRRRISCYQGSHQVDVRHCNSDQKPDVVLPCVLDECARWQHGEWSQCSVTCGEGNQQRQVSCHRGTENVHDRECDVAVTPASTRPCQMAECTVWKHSDWGPCSGSCGQGERQRFIGCYQGNREVEGNQCDQSRKPDTVISCEMAECPVWHQGEWEPCSASCGLGKKEREISCYQGNRKMDYLDCDLSLMPETIMPCDLPECTLWRHGEWGPCSVTCGEGERRRSIHCHQGNEVVSNEQCDVTSKPSAVSACRKTVCPVWRENNWGECSVTCGLGQRQRGVNCYLGNIEIEASRCDTSVMPETTRSCEVTDCAHWFHGEWAQCSVTCGQGEMQRRVSCSSAGQNVDITQCDLSLMPETVRACEVIGCPTWGVGPWDECSVTCGEGEVQRRVSCYQDNRIVSLAQCDLTLMPAQSKPCSPADCPLWRHGDWGPCSVSCGQGYQLRGIQCRHTNDTPLPDSECSLEDRPPKEQNCQMPTCPFPTKPETNPPTTLPPTYPPIKSTSSTVPRINTPVSSARSVLRRPTPSSSQNPQPGPTYNQRGSALLDVPSVTIRGPSERKPVPKSSPVTAMEVLRETPWMRFSSQWRTGMWTECTSTCGYGTRERYVSCRDRYGYISEETDCDIEHRPPAIQQCQSKPCPHWRTGQWNQCSVTCGTGKSSRYVACVNSDNSIAKDEECDVKIRPKDSEVCSNQECLSEQFDASGMSGDRGIGTVRGKWKTGPWSKCSSTCGSGLHQRVIFCQDENGDSDTCSEALRPQNIEVCNTGIHCPRWSFGDWGTCSASCGGGSKSRLVLCRLRSGRTLADASCNILSRPVDTSMCGTRPCATRARWNSRAWNGCSVNCGVGVETRSVICQDESGEERPNEDCEAGEDRMPDTQRECIEADCPKPEWTIGNWSECSVTCGIGSDTRTVTCHDESGVERPDEECEAEGDGKPDTRRECRQMACLAPKWNVEGWNECSVTCGIGSQSRIVICQGESGDERPDKECDADRGGTPAMQRECRKMACPTPKWDVGRWSECSVTCGKGMRYRETACKMKDQVMEESLCLRTKPKTAKKCSREKCLTYRWKKGRWNQCSSTCNGGRKLRKVDCIDSKGSLVDDAMCASRRKPRENTKCNTHNCDSPRMTWLAGPWEECSAQCGPGEQTRSITCQAQSPDSWAIPTDDDSCDRSTKPLSSRQCFLGVCSADVHWVKGPWSQCSKKCGGGFKERKVQCRDLLGKRHPGSMCGPPTIRPETREICNYQPCQPTSCHEIQMQHNMREDKEYSILVQGRPLTVYCHGMRSSTPTEFISLSSGEAENFAEIYPKRLLRPTQCPHNGNRNDNCECTDEGHREAGLTTFRKLRFNVTNMEIVTTDPTFADVRYGDFVPYASAGDCYSSAACPQGRFRINLIGTRLALAPGVDWDTSGYAVTKRLTRDNLDQRVAGRCGGFCGECFPDGRRDILRVTYLS